MWSAVTTPFTMAAITLRTFHNSVSPKEPWQTQRSIISQVSQGDLVRIVYAAKTAKLVPSVGTPLARSWSRALSITRKVTVCETSPQLPNSARRLVSPLSSLEASRLAG